MGKHLRKILTETEVIKVLERYLLQEIGVQEALALLKIKRRQFFKIIKKYRESPSKFSLAYERTKPTRSISKVAEKK